MPGFAYGEVAMTQPAPTPVQPIPGDPAPALANPAPAPPPGLAPAAPAPVDDKPLGPGGEKALAAEREARKALEKKFAPLEQFLGALTGGQKPPDGKSEVELLQERFAEHEKTLADERAARFRAEVAHTKGLTPEQTEWLRGGTREELEASAERLLAAFPAAPAGPRNPAPDPSQGARGGGTPAGDLDARIAEAQSKGDFRAVIALQKQKLLNVPR
jgi:hypothetical protein